MTNATCSVDGCERSRYRRQELCFLHYKREWRLARKLAPNRLCSTPGCGQPHDARGLCHDCYEQAKRRGMFADDRTCSTPGCQRPFYAKDMCRPCYKRAAAGIPLDRPYRIADGAKLAWLTLAVRADTDDCILPPDWWGSLDEHGRGWLNYEGRHLRAHHVALLLVGRPLPGPGLECCHSCDNMGCMQPRHIELDTHTKNMADKVRAGTDPKGERHPLHKLTEEQVLAIRADHRSYAQIAAAYGVAPWTISNVRTRKTWRHI